MADLVESLKKQGVPVAELSPAAAPAAVDPPRPAPGPGPAPNPPGPAAEPSPQKPPEKSDDEKGKEVLGLANMLCVWLIKTNAKAQKIEWTPQLQAYASLSEDERNLLGMVAPSVHQYVGQADELMKKYPWLAPCCFGLGLAWVIRTKTETIKAHAAASLAAGGGAPPPPAPRAWAPPSAASPAVVKEVPPPPGAKNVPEAPEPSMGGLQI